MACSNNLKPWPLCGPPHKLPLCRKLTALLDDHGLGEKLLIVGGNIPRGDHEELKALGVDAVFPTGSKLDEMTDFIRENLP